MQKKISNKIIQKILNKRKLGEPEVIGELVAWAHPDW